MSGILLGTHVEKYNHTLGIVHHAGTVIRSVVIFAEGLFEGESYVV